MSLNPEAPENRPLEVLAHFPSPPGPLALRAPLQDTHMHEYTHMFTHTCTHQETSALPPSDNSTAHRPRQGEHPGEEWMLSGFVESHGRPVWRPRRCHVSLSTRGSGEKGPRVYPYRPALLPGPLGPAAVSHSGVACPGPGREQA